MLALVRRKGPQRVGEAAQSADAAERRGFFIEASTCRIQAGGGDGGGEGRARAHCR